VLQIASLDDQLERLANSPDEPLELRRAALRAIAPRRAKLRPDSFRLLIDDIAGDDPLLRLVAAEIFAKARLNGRQLTLLLQKVQGDALISPAVLLPMLQRSTTSGTSSIVRAYLEDSLRSGWRPTPDALASLDTRLAEPDRLRIQSVLQSTLSTTTDQQARLVELLPLLEGGDADRGRSVFLSSKTACSTCHRVGSEGGHVGPDLTTIGSIRAGRDILESIVFPSSTIAQGFDQAALLTTDGRAISGIIASQTSDTIVVRDSSGAETRLRRDEVEEINRLPTSIMPDGLDRLMSPQEFRDLLAYLQSLR
jgi:putative heme-binding domain-containing protein